jgi:phosphate transport system substrate-binding protein
MRVLAVILLAVSLAACGRRDGRQTIQNKGSDTLFNVAQAWAEKYKEVDPSVMVAVSGGGSGTGISALINGTVDIANCSRRMKPREIELARSKGIEPVEHIVGYDALAVYVHPKNPRDSFTIEELAKIYGEDGPFTHWTHLGVDFPEAQEDEIVFVSRQNNSGTFAYFRKAILGEGQNYRLGTRDMHGSKDVVDLVAKTPGAIGYSGLAYATHEVKLAKVAASVGREPVAPSVATAADGTYPIARPLFMVTRGKPEGMVKAYLDWILSEEGQRLLLEKGYAPVSSVVRAGD